MALLPFGSAPAKSGAGTGTMTTVQDSGVNVDTAVTTLNFTGSGVTVSQVGHVITLTITGGGGTTLAAQYHLTDYGATTTYSWIGTSLGGSGTITKLVLSGNNREVRTVYTATDTFANRVSASYTTSLAYSN